MTIRERTNIAEITERGWIFRPDSSITFQGIYSERGYSLIFERGCKSFINQYAKTISPEFRFENFGNDSPTIICNNELLKNNNEEIVAECSNVYFQLSGEIDFRITYLGKVDIYGIQCGSNS